MGIRSIGGKDDLYVSYTLATPVIGRDELREEVVDTTRRVEPEGLYGSNGVKDSTKKNSIDVTV